MTDLFERFDDPHPPLPDPGDCVRVIGQARRRRQRRHRRVALSATGSVAVGVLAVVGFFFTQGRRLDQVAHVDVATQPSAVPGVQTILVVGTDQGIARSEGAGADSIAAVRIDSGAHTAAVLGIPRDLAVPDPATGADARVSAVFRTGGPGALVDSLHTTLGIDFTHYVQVDPDGFKALIDAAGGVDLRSSVALRDTHSGLRLAGGVCTSLDGPMALSLARSRQVEVDLGGGWTPLSAEAGDLSRMQRNVILGRSILASMQTVDLTDPVAVDHLVDTFVTHVTVDSGLRRDDLIDLVRSVRSIPTAKVQLTWLPVQSGELEGGVAALALGTDWKAAVAAFVAGDAPTSTIPTQQSMPKFPRSVRIILEHC